MRQFLRRRTAPEIYAYANVLYKAPKCDDHKYAEGYSRVRNLAEYSADYPVQKFEFFGLFAGWQLRAERESAVARNRK